MCKPALFVASTVLVLVLARSLSAESCDRIPTLAPIASTLRGLALRTPVQCVAATPEEFRRRAEAAVRHDLDLPRLSSHAAVLAFIGLIPEGYALEQCLVGEFARRAAAFFSPLDNLVVVPTWTQVPDAILIHEIVHALQAQHFATQSFGHKGYLFDDQNLAAAALLEGDAMYVEKEFEESLREGERTSMDPDSQLPAETPACELPEGLARLAGSVYDYGEFFVSTLAQEGRLEELNKAFRSVPKYTSTILFPKLFTAAKNERAAATIAHPPALISKSWGVPLFEARLGEITVRMALKEALPAQAAISAATGWRGDRISVFQSDGSAKVIWSTVWASEGDAVQFQDAWRLVLQSRYGVPIREGVARVEVGLSGHTIKIHRFGLQVLIADEHTAKPDGKKKTAP